MFFVCSLCLALVEIGIILTLQWAGPSLFSIGLTSTGPVAYIINLLLGDERLSVWKIFGVIFTVGGAVYAITASWGNNDDLLYGTISLVITVFAMVGYYVLQKDFYPRYSIVFVTTTTLLLACVVMVIICVVPPFQLDIEWTDYKTILCLIYGALIGQFLLYLFTNACNQVLSTSLVCLYSGIQPVLTPWFDIIRTCYLPDVDPDDRSCEAPQHAVIISSFIVFFGLLFIRTV
eukprot:UN06611